MEYIHGVTTVTPMPEDSRSSKRKYCGDNESHRYLKRSCPVNNHIANTRICNTKTRTIVLDSKLIEINYRNSARVSVLSSRRAEEETFELFDGQDEHNVVGVKDDSAPVPVHIWNNLVIIKTYSLTIPQFESDAQFIFVCDWLRCVILYTW